MFDKNRAPAAFWTRLGLYGLCAGVPFVHPGVSISYDGPGIWTWLVLVPLEIIIAWFFAPPATRLPVWLAMAGLPALGLAAFAAGFDQSAPAMLAAAGAAFVSTALVFKTKGRFFALAFVEELFPLWLLYRYLSYTRSSETAAQASSGFAQLLLALVAVGFLLHGFLLFRAAFPRKDGAQRRDGFILAGGIGLFLALAFLLPGDFLVHFIEKNLLNREADSRPVPIDASGRGLPDGNLRSDFDRGDRGERGDRDGRRGRRPGDRRAGRGELEGIPSDEWGEPRRGSGPGGKQRAVMVVATKLESVYAADAYVGAFDRERGFLYSKGEPLNELPHLRLISTWRDPEPPPDSGRSPEEIFFLSTQPTRYLAYRPSAVEPTVLDPTWHPFEYSYRSISNVSALDAQTLASLREPDSEELGRLAPFLSIPLEEAERRSFLAVVERTWRPGMKFGQTIQAILKSFETYQYELGFDEDTSIRKLLDFVSETKNGDCTEFSHTAAVLGRLLGIPSRVVTGYLASHDLQSQAHLRGLAMLREKIEVLQRIPFEQLLLVTSSHRHSWVQYWLPGHGWVDFESTAFAIPPPPGGDPNEMTVVIPLLEDRRRELPPAFPWEKLGLGLAVLAGATVAALYVLRFGREAALALLARGRGTKAVKAAYELLLMRLIARGYKFKPRSSTPAEYAADPAVADLEPDMGELAGLYSELRYRVSMDVEERQRLREAFGELAARLERASRPAEPLKSLRSLVSLRGLRYL